MNSLKGFLSQDNAAFYKKLAVWIKGTPIQGWDAAEWRYDALGYVIRFSAYGDRSSEWGWEFDHYPIAYSLGGSDDITNLRPLHYLPNASLGGILGGIGNFGGGSR
jgi:hypothetical protein